MTQSVEQQQEPLSLNIIYELAWKQYETQMDAIQAIDGKLNLLFGFGSVAIAVAGFLLQGTFSLFSQALLKLTLIIFPVMLLVTIMSYWFTEFQYPVKVRQVWLDALFWPESVTRRQVVTEIVRAVEENRDPIARKVFFARWAFIFLLMQILAFVLAIYFR